MRKLLMASLTTTLASHALAINIGVEANPVVYGWNLDEEVQSYNLGANIRFAERWTLAATAHQFEIVPIDPDENSINFQHNDHFNLSMRYSFGKGFFVGPAYRYTFRETESTERGVATIRHGVGGIFGQEFRFGSNWYASYSLTAGFYAGYQQKERYDNNEDDPFDEFWEGFAEGMAFVPERTMINAELLQVGYRF